MQFKVKAIDTSVHIEKDVENIVIVTIENPLDVQDVADSIQITSTSEDAFVFKSEKEMLKYIFNNYDPEDLMDADVSYDWNNWKYR